MELLKFHSFSISISLHCFPFPLNLTTFKASHPLKAKAFIVEILPGSSIDLRLEHPENDDSSIDIILSGRFIFSSDVQ